MSRTAESVVVGLARKLGYSIIPTWRLDSRELAQHLAKVFDCYKITIGYGFGVKIRRCPMSIGYERFVGGSLCQLARMRRSKLVGKPIKVDDIGEGVLQPTAEYQHPRSTQPITQKSLNPGAMQ